MQALDSVGNTPFVKSALKKKAVGSGFSQMEPPMLNENHSNSRDMLVQNQDAANYLSRHSGAASMITPVQGQYHQ